MEGNKEERRGGKDLKGTIFSALFNWFVCCCAGYAAIKIGTTTLVNFPWCTLPLSNVSRDRLQPTATPLG